MVLENSHWQLVSEMKPNQEIIESLNKNILEVEFETCEVLNLSENKMFFTISKHFEKVFIMCKSST